MFTSLSLRQLAATLTLGAFAAALTACGGGGSSDSSAGGVATYSGSVEAAIVTEANKDEAARASIEGTIAATESDGLDSVPGAPIAASIGSASASSETLALLNDVVAATLEKVGQFEDVVSGLVIPSIPGDCGGSASYSLDEVSGDYTMTYSNWCIEGDGENVTINGKIISRTINETTTEVTYQNVVVTTSSGSRDVIPNMTITCTGEVCSISSDFVGTDGQVYRIENASVTYNMDTSYDVSVRVYDANLGYVEIEATGILFCEEGIEGGAIIIRNATEFGEDVLVDFSGCNEYTVSILHAPA